jgi:protein-arginine kinase
MTNVEVADKLKAIAEKYFIHEMKMLKEYAGPQIVPYKESVTVLKQDKKDLIKLSSLVRKRAYEEAYEHMSDFDTIVRETLPKYAYNFIMKESGNAHQMVK